MRAARRTDISQQRGDPHGVLVRDATGLVHKGRHAAGVARQDTGTVGPVAHGHIGVCLSSASPLGHALVERERSLPNEGTDDRARCGQAGIPAERPCATAPPRARQRWARACVAGGPATGVTGDRVSGDDRRRRLWVAAQPPPDGWAVSGQAYGGLGWPQRQGKRRLATVPEDGWTRLSAGDGAQGPRWSDGHWRSLTAPLAPGGCRWWLVRRRVSAPTDMTADVVFAPQVTTQPAVVGGAGSRWTMESGVEEATGAVGRDHDAVRSWTGWSRHLARALWALALLTSMRAGTSTGEACKKRLQPPSEAHPLAAFQARRGLASRGAAPHGEGGSGGESWPCRRRPVISSAGHPGVGGTKPSPYMTTISVVRPWWGPWQHNPSCYHCSTMPRDDEVTQRAGSVRALTG